MIVEQKLKDIQKHAADIGLQMNSGNLSGDELARLSKEYSRLSEMLPLINEYFQTVSGIADYYEVTCDELLGVSHESNAIPKDVLSSLKKIVKEAEKALNTQSL